MLWCWLFYSTVDKEISKLPAGNASTAQQVTNVFLFHKKRTLVACCTVLSAVDLLLPGANQGVITGVPGSNKVENLPLA